MMNNEMNNNVVVAPESQGMVQSIVNNQRVQGGAIVIAAALLGFAAYKAYKYVSGKVAEHNAVPTAAPQAQPEAKAETETAKAVEAEVVEEKK